MRHAFAAVLAIAALSACSGDGKDTARSHAISARDSAGVRIIEYASLPTDAPEWKLEVTPAVAIGETDGDANKTFGRISGFAVTSDGSIVVGDAHAQQIRAFDSTGTHRWTAGGKGGGPGEFTSLLSVYAAADDSIYAVDHFPRTLSVFDRMGRFRRLIRLRSPADSNFGSPAVHGVLDNGFILATTSQNFSAASARTGYYRAPLQVLLYDAEGQPGPVLGTFRDYEVQVEDMNGQPIMRPLEFGRYTLASARGSTVAIAETDRFEVRRYDAAGALAQIIRVNAPRTPGGDATRSKYVEHALASIEEDAVRERSRSTIESQGIPDTLPAIDGLQIDDAGRIWVHEFKPPWVDGVSSWWIFETDGTLAARVTSPAAIKINAGQSIVVGAESDSLGVARIVERRILKP